MTLRRAAAATVADETAVLTARLPYKYLHIMYHAQYHKTNWKQEHNCVREACLLSFL